MAVAVSESCKRKLLGRKESAMVGTSAIVAEVILVRKKLRLVIRAPQYKKTKRVSNECHRSRFKLKIRVRMTTTSSSI